MYARYAPALALMAGALAGCKGKDYQVSQASAATPHPTAARVVTLTATDFAFTAPERIPAGATTFHLVNHGKELHHGQIIKLQNGKTMADVAQALKQPGIPSWVKFVGGPNAVPPGKESSATEVLEPGNYALLCFVYGADKVPHAAKGMVKPLEVTASSGTAASALPPADVTIKMVDYGFEPSQAISPGHHTILVKNEGPQPHELALLRLAPGKTVQDFGTWAETGMKGPPPAEPIGGVALLDKGGEGTFSVDLPAGEYGLICFVPDAKDGKPHLVHGMVKTIKVG
jgi:uncharacterized cupredoxin-like copper-binding protein